MDTLNQSIVEAEAQLHRNAFPADWSVFSRSITWFKLRKQYDQTERKYFQQCWEAA